MSSTSEYHITCLCGAVREPGTLLSHPNVPIPSPELCHCNPCRYTTGSLGASFPRLSGPPSKASLDACVSYASSRTHHRWFCRTCGSGTFVEGIAGGFWCCLGGSIERVDCKEKGNGKETDVVRVERHDFVGDTGDGGMALRMLKLGGREIPCAETELEKGEMSVGTVKEMERESIEKGKDVSGKDEKLQVRCHCGGVDLRMRRADYANDTQGVDEDHIPPSKDKYMAYFCACRSCRLAAGVPALPFVYVPPANITVASSGKQVVFGKAADEPGANEGTTLKQYNSSKDVYRSFCGQCGATVFYRIDHPDKAIVDLAAGLLRAEEGIMARRWVSWCWGRLCFAEETVDAEIAEAILGDEGRQGIEIFD